MRGIACSCVLCMCVGVRAHTHTRAHALEHVSACVCVRTHPHICTTYNHTQFHVNVRVCACVYACACVCARVCSGFACVWLFVCGFRTCKGRCQNIPFCRSLQLRILYLIQCNARVCEICHKTPRLHSINPNSLSTLSLSPLLAPFPFLTHSLSSPLLS